MEKDVSVCDTSESQSKPSSCSSFFYWFFFHWSCCLIFEPEFGRADAHLDSNTASDQGKIYVNGGDAAKRSLFETQMEGGNEDEDEIGIPAYYECGYAGDTTYSTGTLTNMGYAYYSPAPQNQAFVRNVILLVATMLGCSLLFTHTLVDRDLAKDLMEKHSWVLIIVTIILSIVIIRNTLGQNFKDAAPIVQFFFLILLVLTFSIAIAYLVVKFKQVPLLHMAQSVVLMVLIMLLILCSGTVFIRWRYNFGLAGIILLGFAVFVIIYAVIAPLKAGFERDHWIFGLGKVSEESLMMLMNITLALVVSLYVLYQTWSMSKYLMYNQSIHAAYNIFTNIAYTIVTYLGATVLSVKRFVA